MLRGRPWKDVVESLAGLKRRKPELDELLTFYERLLLAQHKAHVWNCGHFRVPSACEVVEGTTLADHTCDLWAEEWGGKKARSGFRAGRRKYQDEAWASEGPVSELRPAEPPLAPGAYLCLGCAEEWSLASRSLELPSCPSCGDSRWLAL